MKKILSLCCLLMLICINCVCFGQSAIVKKVWLEHGVQQGGETGMKIHSELSVVGMRGKQIRVCAYFYNEDKSKMYGSTDGYRTSDNQVSVSDVSTVSYDNSTYSDFVLFIPNRALTLYGGKRTYYVNVRVYYPGSSKFISSNEPMISFSGTGSDQSNSQNGSAKKKSNALSSRYNQKGSFYVSCSNRSYLRYNNYKEEFELIDSYEFPCLFKINDKLTVIEHTTPEMTSNYYVQDTDYDEDDVSITFSVISDVGNKYIFMFDFGEETVATIYSKNGETYAIVYTMKRYWEDD